MVEPTQPEKYARQNLVNFGLFHQIGMIINNTWNHHPVQSKSPKHVWRDLWPSHVAYLILPFHVSIKHPTNQQHQFKNRKPNWSKWTNKTRHFSSVFTPLTLESSHSASPNNEVIDPTKGHRNSAKKTTEPSNFVQLLSECRIDDMEIKETSHPPRNFAKTQTPWRFPYSKYSLLNANLTWW